MALFHFHVTQIKRSAGQSAIAAAAYRAGEKLHSDHYGEDSDYTRKSGVIYSEILLPPNASAEYADRQTLWNAVEQVEQHHKAQLAYSMDIALQNEFSSEENISLARQFLLDEFVSRGMIVDFAVHQPDKENGGIQNPHIHVMSPIRPLDENGRWSTKQRRVYELDENGDRLRDADGNYIFSAVPTTDWGSPITLEHWREEWTKRCNTKFAEKGFSIRIDHRSYERQDSDQIPTIHEGPVVRQLEAKGVRTNKGELNRWIRTINALLRKIKNEIAKLSGWFKENAAAFQEQKMASIVELLSEYYTIRNAGAYSRKAKTGNLKRYAEDINFLQSRGINNLVQLHGVVSDLSDKYSTLNTSLKQKAARMQELKTLLRLTDDYANLKPIVENILPKGGFGRKREKYMAEHDAEIRRYYAVKRQLDNALPDKKLMPKVWQTEFDRLEQEYAAGSKTAKVLWNELKRLRDIRYKVDIVLHDQQAKEKSQIEHERER